jgi:hypothetical protein
MKKAEYFEGMRIHSGDAPGFKGHTIGPLWLKGNNIIAELSGSISQRWSAIGLYRH